MKQLKFRKPADGGAVQVRVKTPSGVQWVNTGQPTIVLAREVCDQANVMRLQLAAAANALTADVIGRLTTGSAVTFKEALERWEAEYAPRLSPHTMSTYLYRLKQCFRELKCLDKPLNVTGKIELGSWLNRGVEGTRQKKLTALKSFYRYVQGVGIFIGNPAELLFIDVRSMLLKDRIPKITDPMTKEECQILLSSSKVSPFWKIAIVIGYWTGFRISDIAALQWASLQVDRIVIFQKKTGSMVALMLSDVAIGSEELREALVSIPPNDSMYCFPEEHSQSLDPIRRTYLSKGFVRLLGRHGIKGKHFHSIRHACALRLKALGRTTAEVGQVLGHASESSTEIYLDHDSPVPSADCI